MQRRKTPYVTKVTFVTTGIFLMRLVNNPDSLKKYTHIIMDEVHERDLDIDFSMVVVKHLLARTEEDSLKFKLILMSATFNTELFANYFSKKSISEVELIQSYAGVEEEYRRKAEEEKLRRAREWGPNGGKNLEEQKAEEDEDEWVECKAQTQQLAPVKKASDPAHIIEINARCYVV